MCIIYRIPPPPLSLSFFFFSQSFSFPSMFLSIGLSVSVSASHSSHCPVRCGFPTVFKVTIILNLPLCLTCLLICLSVCRHPLYLPPPPPPFVAPLSVCTPLPSPRLYLCLRLSACVSAPWLWSACSHCLTHRKWIPVLHVFALDLR